jgi:hypothetical protein
VISAPPAGSIGALALARPPLPSLALIAAWAAALELSGPHHGVVLALAPLLLLLASLVAGRYVGEGRLARLRSRCAARRPGRADARPPAPPGSNPALSRGGPVIAWRLAGRAPPALLD